MLVCDRSKCTGCGACADACPKGCIELRHDDNGFLHSYVDETRCVGCKRCIQVCPVHHPQNHNTMLRSYKFRRKDTTAILGSTSGGVAALLAETVIADGGAVCGCGFDAELKLRHTVVTEPSGLEAFKGSKYVQSQTAGVYKAVQQVLKKGQKLLFVGTPCQVSGLKAFLGKEYENLITVDLVCHGIGSQKVLDRYIANHSGDQPICNIRFRSKQRGYRDCQKNDLIFEYSDGQKEIDHSKGIVLWFASGLSLRESCYSCCFASPKRCADLTLADYVGEDLTDEDRHYGVSMVFTNTPKGETMLNSILASGEAQELPVAQAQQRYLALRQKSEVPKARKVFFRDLDRLSLKELEEKYTLQAILPGKLSLYARAAVNRFKRFIKVKRT